MTDEKALLVRFRVWLGLFIIGLVLSGVTAFPLAWEVRILTQYVGPNTAVANFYPPLAAWIGTVDAGL